MPRSYPPEFRRRVLDLVASGRKVAEVAQFLGVSDQTIYNWRRQHLIDTGQIPGTTSSDQVELATGARRRNGAPYRSRGRGEFGERAGGPAECRSSGPLTVDLQVISFGLIDSL